jgi:hypothetical protein
MDARWRMHLTVVYPVSEPARAMRGSLDDGIGIGQFEILQDRLLALIDLAREANGARRRRAVLRATRFFSHKIEKIKC